MESQLLTRVKGRLATLKGRYQSEKLAHHQDISDFLIPMRGQFYVERPKKAERMGKILDSTGTRALRILAAGLMAGATSPMRPWMRLAPPHGVGQLPLSRALTWADVVTRAILALFAKTNTYHMLHQLYEELGAFGTAASLVAQHPTRVMHCYPLTVGEFFPAASPEGPVNTLYREFDMTVAQLVAEFGLERCSNSVQQMYKAGSLDQDVRVAHAIEPRADRDPSKLDQKNKPWRSVYWEYGSEVTDVLREGGFDRFPAVVPRWSVTGTQTWGDGPGTESLPDIKMLQLEQQQKGIAIRYQADPPVQAPSELKHQEFDKEPGGVTYTDAASAPNAGVRELFRVSLDINGLTQDMVEVRQRINSTFFADLFLMLFQSEKTMSATEAAALQQEKMLMLGPVLEFLGPDLFKPLIDLGFDALWSAGLLPPPPEELAGQDLQIEYLSVLAQAQRAAALGLTDRFIASVQSVSQQFPEALDKVNVDAWIDDMAERLGVTPEIVRSKDEVAQLRDARNKALAAKEQTEMAAKQAGAARDIAAAAADAPVGSESFSSLGSA